MADGLVAGKPLLPNKLILPEIVAELDAFKGERPQPGDYQFECFRVPTPDDAWEPAPPPSEHPGPGAVDADDHF